MSRSSKLHPIPEGGAQDATSWAGKISEAELSTLYERYNRPVYAFFLKLGFTREESRDLMQDTFLEVSRSAAGFRGSSNVSTWIFGIAKHVWMQRLRDRSRLKRKAEELPLDEAARGGALDAHGAASGLEGEPLEGLLDDEKARLLREAVAELPDKMRHCVNLFFVRELKTPEIAAVMGIAESTVRSQLTQARQKLREKLREHFPDL